MTLRRCCFTVNNYRDTDQKDLLDADMFSYIVVGKEVAPTTGTPHLQCYGELKKVMRMKAIQKELFKILDQKVHIEKAKGTSKEASSYCKEDGDFEERGTPRGQGKRTDLADMRDGLRSGKLTMTDIADGGSYNFQQIKVAEKYFQYMPVSLDYHPKEVYWYYGKTRVGKSRRCIEEIKADGRKYFLADTAQWMDGYGGEPLVFIDELRPGDWPYVKMLKLLDHFDKKWPVKTSYTVWCPDKIWITTPFSPEDTYYMTADMEGGIEQLLARLTKIECIGPENKRNNPSVNLLEDRWNTVDLREKSHKVVGWNPITYQ